MKGDSTVTPRSQSLPILYPEGKLPAKRILLNNLLSLQRVTNPTDHPRSNVRVGAAGRLSPAARAPQAQPLTRRPNAAPSPQLLDVGGDPRQAVYPIHDAMLLDEFSAALEDLGD